MVVMANHFHLIYTPKGLEEMLEASLLAHDKYVCCAEIGKGGLHFHAYIITDVTRDTVSDKLKATQKIPSSGVGKRSLHYSNRAVAEHPAAYPEQDLRKFTLGYVQKQESRKFMKGFTEEELDEALAYYRGQTEDNADIRRAQIAPGMSPAEGIEPRREVGSPEKNAIQDEWLEFSIEMMKGLVNPFTNKCEMVGINYFHKKAWNYWKKRNHGLFPVSATQKRFKQSIWALYLDKCGQEVDVEDLKLNSML